MGRDEDDDELRDLVRKQMSGQGRHFGIVDGVRSGEDSGRRNRVLAGWRIGREVGLVVPDCILPALPLPPAHHLITRIHQLHVWFLSTIAHYVFVLSHFHAAVHHQSQG